MRRSRQPGELVPAMVVLPPEEGFLPAVTLAVGRGVGGLAEEEQLGLKRKF